jgi:hypothetical protein
MQILTSAVPQHQLTLIQRDLASRQTRPGIWRDNRQTWNPALIHGFTGAVYVTATSAIVNSIMRNLLPVTPHARVVTQYCQWFPGSGIHAHCDEIYNLAATLYLNTQWTQAQGGQFCTEHSEVTPALNTCVINTGSERHWVTAVRDSVRLTLQTWVS